MPNAASWMGRSTVATWSRRKHSGYMPAVGDIWVEQYKRTFLIIREKVDLTDPYLFDVLVTDDKGTHIERLDCYEFDSNKLWFVHAAERDEFGRPV